MSDTIDLFRLFQVICGAWFIPHLIGKIRHFGKAQGTFEAAGLKPGVVFLIAAIVMETVAVIGLGAGLAPRTGGLVGAMALLGAAYAVVRINGFNWRWQNMGPEYPLFWAMMCLIAGFIQPV
ncbi:DoxX family protein [Roseinatronobacter alkalisoli]|uniref:DoxX family protein n=1 Tax=Roseinatronobacter alkalisoli TaxID=3028235 RepID=A0ABT5TDR6_9RHOB|nr:DoxX family protein [Roseinatronobacter sp. HJB301]MDD7972845.1 DoxX family protein [Roseinatronobacter sp. HJB301]